MITNEVQYRATKAHLAKFDEAAANLEATLTKGGASARLTQLELDAVRAQASDLRAEIEEYERLRAPGVSCERCVPYEPAWRKREHRPS